MQAMQYYSQGLEDHIGCAKSSLVNVSLIVTLEKSFDRLALEYVPSLYAGWEATTESERGADPGVK